MQIRKAAEGDEKGIAVVHVDSWKETYRGIIPDSVLDNRTYERQEKMWKNAIASLHPDGSDGRIILVAEDHDGSIAGFATAGKNRSDEYRDSFDAELFAIYILQSAHKKGIGRRLTAELSRFLVEKGYESIMVWVLKDNPAVRFYARLGGRPVGKRTEEIGGAELEELALGWELEETLSDE
ncbi:GNAT family N-acetyltransferase [Alteribacter natronophilus]|uniref:GNAT family N-acetyltransferase n=1 Tax=Alteribacter natronophilus TaxID=2583810 RepID=UPI00110F6048|nr:GNAT family N-acetyltransferase [Alteribacter natronophilus]TMW70642.1 GNAT family N-acetyltransferase [Alteribacter natronophilus]